MTNKVSEEIVNKLIEVIDWYKMDLYDVHGLLIQLARHYKMQVTLVANDEETAAMQKDLLMKSARLLQQGEFKMHDLFGDDSSPDKDYGR